MSGEKNKNIEIKSENVKTLLDAKFIRVFDLQYAPGRHYYDATRRKADDLVAVKTDKEFRAMSPDAVSCFVIVHEKEKEPRLLLTQEYRYPAGRFLLSVPAGLIDPQDRENEGGIHPALKAAAREIHEETGLTIKEGDRLKLVNPLLFSSPGMTDESNALVCADVYTDDLSVLTDKGAVGSELFDGFRLLTRAQARKILEEGMDEDGIFYSVYTWCALAWFCAFTV